MLMWDKVSKFLGHLANTKFGSSNRSNEYFEFTEFLPPNTAQRRTHLRLDLFLPINFWRVIKKAGGAQLSDESVVRGEFERIQTCGGMGLNLSGSGVLIISAEKFEKDDYIEINDRIFGKQMCIYGRVTRSTMTNFDNSLICEFGVKFLKISDADRDFIVRAIFDKIKMLRQINEENSENY